MSKSRQERRRARARTETRRLRRFERSLVGIIPPKGIVGPFERLWRSGKISNDAFWCATHFAVCYEATLPDIMLYAGSAECRFDSPLPQMHERIVNRLRLQERYRVASKHLWALAAEGTIDLSAPVAFFAAAVHKMAFDQIDRELHKATLWARDSSISTLQHLSDFWGFELIQAYREAAAERVPLV